jgi:class 3 adenylate cyclase
MDPPETRYARSGDIHIAYQVIGNGSLDLIHAPGFISNVEMQWESPGRTNLFSRLAGFSRLILFDKRGTGLSDRHVGVPHLDERMDDIRAVMDAVGCQSAALFGISDGGPMSMLFAATYPERTRALVLYGSFARFPPPKPDPQYHLDLIERQWGTGEYCMRYMNPGNVSNETARRLTARWERQSASPSAAVAAMRMAYESDVGDILPTIRVPTLVLHRTGDTLIDIRSGRYIADHIPGAKFAELPGANHAIYSEPEIIERVVNEIEEFLTGSRSRVEVDRVLATLLFTDIVDSTKRASELGDRRWRSLLRQHDQSVRDEIGRFRGREVKSLGDGFLATFDGPARAVRCAAAIANVVQPLGLNVRSGLHTGEIELTPQGDIAGIAVHTAARVMAMAEPGEILVSSTVRDLVAGSGLRFEDRGPHTLRGLPEQVRLYTVVAT